MPEARFVVEFRRPPDAGGRADGAGDVAECVADEDARAGPFDCAVGNYSGSQGRMVATADSPFSSQPGTSA